MLARMSPAPEDGDDDDGVSVCPHLAEMRRVWKQTGQWLMRLRYLTAVINAILSLRARQRTASACPAIGAINVRNARAKLKTN